MRWLGHPVHPMLVHFPIVFWSCALVADVVSLTIHASPARDVSVSHLMAMCSAWLIYLVALALHGYPPKTPVPLAALIASAAGFLTMAYGAWLGGRLVYLYRVGMP